MVFELAYIAIKLQFENIHCKWLSCLKTQSRVSYAIRFFSCVIYTQTESSPFTFWNTNLPNFYFFKSVLSCCLQSLLEQIFGKRAENTGQPMSGSGAGWFIWECCWPIGVTQVKPSTRFPSMIWRLDKQLSTYTIWYAFSWLNLVKYIQSIRSTTGAISCNKWKNVLGVNAIWFPVPSEKVKQGPILKERSDLIKHTLDMSTDRNCMFYRVQQDGQKTGTQIGTLYKQFVQFIPCYFYSA